MSKTRTRFDGEEVLSRWRNFGRTQLASREDVDGPRATNRKLGRDTAKRRQNRRSHRPRNELVAPGPK